jgi:hypothetical protein
LREGVFAFIRMYASAIRLATQCSQRARTGQALVVKRARSIENLDLIDCCS